MFTYCSNQPISRLDVSGKFYKDYPEDMNVNCYAWALGISIESMEGGLPKPFNEMPAPGFFSNDYTNKWNEHSSLQETLDMTE